MATRSLERLLNDFYDKDIEPNYADILHISIGNFLDENDSVEIESPIFVKHLAKVSRKLLDLEYNLDLKKLYRFSKEGVSNLDPYSSTINNITNFKAHLLGYAADFAYEIYKETQSFTWLKTALDDKKDAAILGSLHDAVYGGVASGIAASYATELYKKTGIADFLLEAFSLNQISMSLLKTTPQRYTLSILQTAKSAERLYRKQKDPSWGEQAFKLYQDLLLNSSDELQLEALNSIASLSIELYREIPDMRFIDGVINSARHVLSQQSDPEVILSVSNTVFGMVCKKYSTATSYQEKIDTINSSVDIAHSAFGLNSDLSGKIFLKTLHWIDNIINKNNTTQDQREELYNDKLRIAESAKLANLDPLYIAHSLAHEADANKWFYEQNGDIGSMIRGYTGYRDSADILNDLKPSLSASMYFKAGNCAFMLGIASSRKKGKNGLKWFKKSRQCFSNCVDLLENTPGRDSMYKRAQQKLEEIKIDNY